MSGSLGRLKPWLSPVPDNRLAPAAAVLWALRGAVTLVPGLIGTGLLARLLEDEVGTGASAIAWTALGLYALGAVVVLPVLRWRRWRWDVRDDEIELLQGVVVVRRTLVPIRRIQHVDTERGPLQQMLGLATVSLHTAAGQNAIPQLLEPEAERVREQIAALTRTPDEL